MKAHRIALLALAVGMALGTTAQAADCTTIDFEDKATGTPVFGPDAISDLLTITGFGSMEVLEEGASSGFLAYRADVDGIANSGPNWLPGDNAKSFGNASSVRGADVENLRIDFSVDVASFSLDIADYGDWFPSHSDGDPRTGSLKAWSSNNVMISQDGLNLDYFRVANDVFIAGLRNLSVSTNDEAIAYVTLEFDDVDPGISFDNIEFCELDADDDGVPIYDDLCPGTVADIDAGVPSSAKGIGKNRWIWNGAVWETNAQGVDKSFTIEETQGCSCNQILDELVDITDLEFDGHYKFGCSQSVVEDWISGLYYMETVEIPAADKDGVDSSMTLKAAENYQLMAYGVADALNTDGRHIPFDAKYSVTTGDPEQGYPCGEDPDTASDWTDIVCGYPGYGPQLLDLYVDGANIDWGAFNFDHVYWYGMPGTDNPVTLWIYDAYYPNNVGSLYVDIFVELW